jgi:arylsulfatase A-like enzyme
VRVPPFLPDTPEVRQDLAHYYDAISRMDADCGVLLGLLEQRGLARNTLVVMTADNGMPFPRAKGGCYDPGIRVPLLARWPGRIAPGVRDDLIGHVDVAPTWLDAAGIPKPSKMQGRSFLPLLEGRTYQARDAVFSERNWHDNFDPIRSARTAGYKLIFNAAPHFPYRPAWDLENSPSWASLLAGARRGKLTPQQMQLLNPARPLLELYDVRSDPDEFHNLVTSPAHAGALAGMKDRLSRWMHETYDFLPPAFAAPGEPAGRGWPVSL